MRVLAFLLISAIPLPAFALSCRPPTVEATYERLQESDDVYVVVHGRLVVNESKLPRTSSSSQKPPKMTRIPATILGRSLSEAGFRTPFEQKITLYVACFGPWCGTVANGSDVLAFLKREKGEYALAVDPCGGDLFINPHSAMLKKAQSCFKRGQC